jgi:hypothetical protein
VLLAVERTSPWAAATAGLYGLVVEADPVHRDPLVDALSRAIAGYWSTLDTSAPTVPADDRDGGGPR